MKIKREVISQRIIIWSTFLHEFQSLGLFLSMEFNQFEGCKDILNNQNQFTFCKLSSTCFFLRCYLPNLLVPFFLSKEPHCWLPILKRWKCLCPPGMASTQYVILMFIVLRGFFWVWQSQGRRCCLSPFFHIKDDHKNTAKSRCLHSKVLDRVGQCVCNCTHQFCQKSSW